MQGVFVFGMKIEAVYQQKIPAHGLSIYRKTDGRGLVLTGI